MEPVDTLAIELSLADGGRRMAVAPVGELRMATSGQLYDEVAGALSRERPGLVEVDFARVSRLDSSGVAALSALARLCQNATDPEGGARLRVHNLAPAHRELLALTPRQTTLEVDTRREPGFLEGVGEYAIDGADNIDHFYDNLADTAIATMGMLRGRLPPHGALIQQAVRVGVDAVPIVALLSILLGLVLGFQSADQLERFGAGIFVADIVGIGMFREFGPILTGIVLAGRSGSSMAAELGTMRVNEEIDALRTMGIDPSRFLVLPRLLALLLVQPALTLMSSLLGSVGGFIIGTLYVQIPANAYVNESIHAITLADLLQGQAKSVVFAVLIGIIACYAGMTVRGGAAGVGRATTRAVVVSIFMIIVADSIFTTVSTLAS